MITAEYKTVNENEVKDWHFVANEEQFPHEGGAAVLVNELQIAVFNFASKGQWYATQNLCPHKQQMILSRGMIGTQGEEEEPKVACPFHKKVFSLETGENLNGNECALATYPVKVENGKVYVGL